MRTLEDEEFIMDEKLYQEETIEEQERRSLFRMKTANDWMSEAEKKPKQKHLFGDFWFENELCVLFADTNVGKSILAVQIADSISRGAPISPLCVDAEPQLVLYFDFELSERQFFIRLDIDVDAEIPYGDYCQYVCDQIEAVMLDAGAQTAILDNITYLGEELEKSKGALSLMKRLKDIKQIKVRNVGFTYGTDSVLTA